MGENNYFEILKIILFLKRPAFRRNILLDPQLFFSEPNWFGGRNILNSTSLAFHVGKVKNKL